MAQSAVLSKLLSYDLIWVAKLAVARMDNDTDGCYAKLVPSHRRLCCWRLGLTNSTANKLAKVLRNTVFYLRMGHLISVKIYYSDSVYRILGTRQGSSASPCTWSAIIDTSVWSLAHKYVGFYIEIP